MSDAAVRSAALVTLLRSLIDYAGLFPPAGLSMSEAVQRFDTYRRSPDAWALGRFVVPVSRLGEFESAVERLQLGAAGASSSRPAAAAWPLTALGSFPIEEDMERVSAFNSRHAATDAAWSSRIESLEVKATRPEEIATASAAIPAEIEVFFEVPARGDIDDLCAAASTAGRGLKIRTGGTTLDAFPPSTVVARFLGACAAARLPFKATAGLHHAVRSSHPVSNDDGAPTATMHGFLNVFVAAALLFSGKAPVAVATGVLEDEVPASFRPAGDDLAWRGQRLSRQDVAAARAFARGFGSCAFEEPLRELDTFL